jgi:CheY-like chemotaxis protein
MANLLIVEDDPVLLAGMEELLSFDGHQVRAVLSGQAALNAIEADPPELVISDVFMPGMSGPQLLAAVRTRANGDAIPFLFVSAGTMREVEEQIAGPDSVSYLPKPFQVEALLEAVAGAVAVQPGRVSAR